MTTLLSAHITAPALRKRHGKLQLVDPSDPILTCTVDARNRTSGVLTAYDQITT
jgi:hypothetical protein